MGLTLYYDWKIKADLSSARRMIARFRANAPRLPFDEGSEIYEQDSLDNMPAFRKYDASFARVGSILPSGVPTETKKRCTSRRCTHYSSRCASRARRPLRLAWLDALSRRKESGVDSDNAPATTKT